MNIQLNDTKVKLAGGASALILGTALMSTPAVAQNECRNGPSSASNTLECGFDSEDRQLVAVLVGCC